MLEKEIWGMRDSTMTNWFMDGLTGGSREKKMSFGIIHQEFSISPWGAIHGNMQNNGHLRTPKWSHIIWTVEKKEQTACMGMGGCHSHRLLAQEDQIHLCMIHITPFLRMVEMSVVQEML